MASKKWKKLDRNLQRNFINKLIGQQIINRHFFCPAEKFIHVLFEMLIDHLHVIFTVANHSKGNRCLSLVRAYCCPRNPPPGCPYSTSDKSSFTFLSTLLINQISIHHWFCKNVGESLLSPPTTTARPKRRVSQPFWRKCP